MRSLLPRLCRARRAAALVSVSCLGLLSATAVLAYTQDLPLATDLNADPDIFEMNLSADEAVIDLDGDGLGDDVFAFNGSVPGPTLQVEVGDLVIVHFTNNLDALSSMVHWHGIELGNDSDGTHVSQDAVMPGGSFTYTFRANRPGLYWYHPHLMATDETFRGLYGAIVVADPADATLVSAGVLPPASNTKTVVLSDVTVCTGAEVSGLCAAAKCGPGGDQTCAKGDIPFVQPNFDCGLGGPGACLVNHGTTILVNGQKLEASDRLDIANGTGVRLRVMNQAILRFFRLVPPAGLTFYRVGGDTGLLDAVRLEGGVPLIYPGVNQGEILLGPGDRADVVLVPVGSNGQQFTVTAQAYGITGGGSNPVLRFRLVGTAGSQYAIAEGTPLRTHPLVDDPVEVLPASGVAQFRAPSAGGSLLGSADPIVRLTAPSTSPCQSSDECHDGSACRDVDIGMAIDLSCPDQSTSANCACVEDGNGPAIDGFRGTFDAGSHPDYTLIPHLRTSRFARVGDLLEVTVRNETMHDHPFHLHGFSYQPVRFETLDGTTEYTFDYAEFVDNAIVPADEALVLRVRLDDRPVSADALAGGTGGAQGRWLFHCHLFHHAALGMISELVVLEAALFEDGFESGTTAEWSQAVP